MYLELYQISTKELFCEDNQRLKDVNYFHENAKSQMFDRVLNMHLVKWQYNLDY